MNDLISVIVPVYNTKEYLNRCIESLINQTYRNIEIILVNDGSTDNSEEICKEYCKKDNRIRYYYKENNGLSDTRNFGIIKATGKYLSFVDSDDYVDYDFLKCLYNNLIENDADISYCSFYRTKSLNIKNFSLTNDADTKCFNSKDAIKSLLEKNGTVKNYICMGLYKAELFKEIRFPIGVNFEDIAITYRLLYKSKKVVVSNKKNYYYYINCNGITKKMREKDIIDRYNNIQRRNEFIMNKYPDMKCACDKYLARTYSQMIKDYLKYNYNKIMDNDFFEVIRKQYLELGLKEFSYKNLIIYCLIKLNNKKMYKIFHKIIERG